MWFEKPYRNLYSTNFFSYSAYVGSLSEVKWYQTKAEQMKACIHTKHSFQPRICNTGPQVCSFNFAVGPSLSKHDFNFTEIVKSAFFVCLKFFEFLLLFYRTYFYPTLREIIAIVLTFPRLRSLNIYMWLPLCKDDAKAS